ncbi:MAG: succinate dehydrogenase, hydrophobic membrane anchor protein [Proteobacteria bacterium]|nr:succinate dehydrogenase, hydrophobic membrane anchor protein [Pseudomonadota bacterium]
MSLRSPLGRVLGLGSAREGVTHWWAQRVGAVALVPLCLWLVLSLAALGSLDHEAVVGFLRQPLNTLLALLLVLAGAHHSYLGVEVVIEDYVHAPAAKITGLVLSRLAHMLAAAAGVFALLRIAFGNHFS